MALSIRTRQRRRGTPYRFHLCVAPGHWQAVRQARALATAGI